MRCIFTPGLYSGNKEIDRQHIKMFEMADEIIKAIENALPKAELIELVKDYSEQVMFHTAEEEAFMQREGYPKRYEHKRIHESIRGKARELIIRFDENDDAEDLSFIILEFVIDLVLEHIRRYDLEMVEYFNIRNNMNSML